MAGGSTSEEMDAPSFEDVTPPRPVSIYDLDEDIPTRMQSSDEIAEYQRKARERRDPTHRSFARSSDPDSPPSGRPIPRESGPVLIDRARPSATKGPTPSPAPAEPELDLDEVLSDIAATIERLPPAPRVPKFDRRDATPEMIHVAATRAVAAIKPRRSRAPLAWAALLLVVTLGAVALFVLAR
jgi:hypothetical protein